MAKLISASINLSKVDKTKLITGKDGVTKYLPILIHVNDEADDYNNDVAISEAQTKDEREAKAKKNYLGNGKTIWSNEAAKQSQPNNTTKSNDDLPF